MIPESYAKHRLPTTVQHEKIHLLQKKHPELWEVWYEQLWKYKLHDAPPAGMPNLLLTRRRNNPDTDGKPWSCWRDRYWSVACFTTENPQSLNDATTYWWDAETGATTIEPPPEWSEFFGLPAQDEHPHEIAAQMIANKTGNKNRIQELTTLYENHFHIQKKDPK